MNDVRFAVRSLLKSPGFTAGVVLTLALGIGCASAIFSVADRVLFRPLPYPDAQHLVVFGKKSKSFEFLQGVQPIELAAYRESTKSFAAFAACRTSQKNLVADGLPLGVSVGAVPADYFSILGTVPLLGRFFVPGEDAVGGDNVLVLSHRFWSERFNKDPEVLNRDVMLGEARCRIVGVLPASFRAPDLHNAQVYQPLVLRVNPAQPVGEFLWLIGRLRPEVSLTQAQAELEAVKHSGSNMPYFKNSKPVLRPLAPHRGLDKTTWTLVGAVGFLYAIACANAANLTLARVHNRRRELCVRLAIGCSRRRLIMLIAVESLMLTVAAGALGLLAANWILPFLLWLGEGAATGMQSTSHLDWRVVAFTVVLSVMTGLLVCIPPAWRIAQSDAIEGLKAGGSAVGESRPLQRLRAALVVAEAAMAAVLLIGTGLMARTVWRMQQIDWGIDPGMKAALSLANAGRAGMSPGAQRAFYTQVEEKLRTVPGVAAVSIATTVPFGGSATWGMMRQDGTSYRANWSAVTPEFRSMLGMRIVKGRWFDDARPTDAPVVVMNETMARDLFGDGDPIGQLFQYNKAKGFPAWTIIGVARDVRQSPRTKSRPQFFFPQWQSTEHVNGSVLLRLTKPVDAAMNDAVRRAIYSIDPMIAVMGLRPLSEAVEQRLSTERYTLNILRVLAVLALGLAVLGLFAVTAYSVTQRMREFGVRAALGALPIDLLRLVLVGGAKLIAIGVAIGCVTAVALTRLVQSLLYETSPHDPLVYAAVAAALLAAGVLGCWLPARRAMKVDVATLLRTE